MPRPDFITQEDIARWSDNIDKDPTIKDKVKHFPLREVCFAGLYLSEQLAKQNCPTELIIKINFTAGRLSFGRDPWEITMIILEQYKNDQLIFEDDSNKELN